MAEFYLDHNVALELAERLRLAGHGTRTARDEGMERAGDDAQLSLAAHWDWTLITHNAKDFALLQSAWRRWSREWGVAVQHAGILVLIAPVSPLQAAREVAALLISAQELANQLHKWRRITGWVRQS